MLADYKLCTFHFPASWVSLCKIFLNSLFLPFSFRLVSLLLRLFASLFFFRAGKLTYVLPFRSIWSSLRSIRSLLTQIKRRTDRAGWLKWRNTACFFFFSQHLPSNTPRKQQPAGCASCSLPGGENHSDPRRQRNHSASVAFSSLECMSANIFLKENVKTEVFSQSPCISTFVSSGDKSQPLAKCVIYTCKYMKTEQKGGKDHSSVLAFICLSLCPSFTQWGVRQFVWIQLSLVFDVVCCVSCSEVNH